MSAAAAITPYVSAGQFLDAIYQGVEEGWAHTFRLDRTTGERHVNWAPIGQHHRLASDAARHLDTSCIWFGPAVRSSNLGQRRGGREDCTLITALWLDVDVAGPQHAVENLPPTRAAAYQLIGDYPMPPSAIVDTGNGLQAWWFLAEPLSATEAESLLARWGATWDELASRRGWHVDNVFDLARIMRLPATWNHKGEPREVYVTDWAPDRRFSPDDIDQWTIEPPAAPAPERRHPCPTSARSAQAKRSTWSPTPVTSSRPPDSSSTATTRPPANATIGPRTTATTAASLAPPCIPTAHDDLVRDVRGELKRHHQAALRRVRALHVPAAWRELHGRQRRTRPTGLRHEGIHRESRAARSSRRLE